MKPGVELRKYGKKKHRLFFSIFSLLSVLSNGKFRIQNVIFFSIFRFLDFFAFSVFHLFTFSPFVKSSQTKKQKQVKEKGKKFSIAVVFKRRKKLNAAKRRNRVCETRLLAMDGNAETRKPGEKLIPPEGMTKSAYKKMLRKKRHEETKEQYREHRKQLKKSKDMERREEIDKLKASGKPYEHLLKPRNKNRITKTIGNGEETVELAPIDPSRKIGVIIDCGYDDYMNEKEVVSLSSQITRAYSSNRQAVKSYYSKEIERKQEGNEEPLEYDIAPAAKLVVSGLDKRLKERFDKVLPDYAKWDPECAQFSEQPLQDVIDAWTEKKDGDVEGDKDYTNVVYLSADTEEKLTELKPGEIYVVGGIVDKGRHKNLCKGTAEKLGKGIRILRLPIDEYIKLSGRKVLTTAHVVELLLKWCEYKDWKRAFEEVLPPRKMGKGDADDVEGDE